jgi:hypothetical protein
MESISKTLDDMQKQRERNAFTPSKAMAVIEAGRANFLKHCERFPPLNPDHAASVLAGYDSDIAAITAGKVISIVKYTWQGAFIQIWGEMNHEYELRTSTGNGYPRCSVQRGP